MICSQCGEEMRMTAKDTSTGRDIREYECSRCGHTDWEDRGSAFWKVLSEFNEEFRDLSGNSTPENVPGHCPEPPQAQAAPQSSVSQTEAEVSSQKQETPEPQADLWDPESARKRSWWDRFGSWMGWGR
jgi:ribosomal protein S27AE